MEFREYSVSLCVFGDTAVFKALCYFQKDHVVVSGLFEGCHGTPFMTSSSPCFLCRGGAELLFDGVKDHHVTLPSQSEPCKY